MNPTPKPPPGPSGDDEILSSLARLERFLLRVIEGIFIFFVHRLPKWAYEVIRGCLENLWEYLGRFIRILVRLARVAVLSAVLIAIIVGPGVAIYQANWHPLALLAWVVAIIGATLFALRRRMWKEYEEWKRRKAASTGRRQKCRSCNTIHPGASAPSKCSICGNPWVGVDV